MTVRDLLKQEITVDVYDSYDERCAVAFVGAQKLTPEGEEHYKEALEMPIWFSDNSVVVVECQTANEANEVADLFGSIAGFCSVIKWNKYFKEG